MSDGDCHLEFLCRRGPPSLPAWTDSSTVAAVNLEFNRLDLSGFVDVIQPERFPNSLNGGGSLSVRFVMADGDGDGDGEGGRGGGWGWGWGKGRGMCFEDTRDALEMRLAPQMSSQMSSLSFADDEKLKRKSEDT